MRAGNKISAAAATQSEYSTAQHSRAAQPRHSSTAGSHGLTHLTPPLSVLYHPHSLLESEHGNEIDGNDCVWRMNRAPTKGYEKHVCVITATERGLLSHTYTRPLSTHCGNAPLSLTAVSAAAVPPLCCCVTVGRIEDDDRLGQLVPSPTGYSYTPAAGQCAPSGWGAGC